MQDDRLVIAGREFKSRLWVGTGKYKDFAETKKAIEVSGADVVTVAVRRVNITDRSKKSARLHRPEEIYHSSQYGRLLYGGGCGPIFAVGAGSRRIGSREAGSARRRKDVIPRHGRLD